MSELVVNYASNTGHYMIDLFFLLVDGDPLLAAAESVYELTNLKY